VHPDGVWIKSGARAGDAVFLTKPLGTGLVLARKRGLEEAGRWMTTLNDRAAQVLRPFSAHALTDVTGFGLLGHALELARGASAGIRLRYRDLPWLAGVEALAARGIVTGASARNWASYGSDVELDPALPEMACSLLTDPQTSGGLLVACAPGAADDVLACFRAEGFAHAAVIGEMTAGAPRIVVA